jgi:ADP-heptose:LPS heptosyltransferase
MTLWPHTFVPSRGGYRWAMIKPRPSYRHEPDVERIAVLRANALGDLMFTMPALYALRAAYPSAEIVLLGTPWHQRFLTGRPGPVDRVIVLPALPGVRYAEPDESAPLDPRAAREEFLARTRPIGFDLALQMHGGGRHTNPIVAGLGARVTAGVRAPDAPPLDRWIRFVYYQSELFRHLEVASLVGAPPVMFEPLLEISEQDRIEAKRLVPEDARPLAALHPGASDARRRWPADRFVAVGDALAASGAHVVVTGTPPERALVDEVVRAMRRPARPLVEASIGGLAALLARCTVVVSNDTGPLHIAEAVGTRTVGLYWVGNVINAAPILRERHRPLLSWTIHCPVCGQDCTRDLYPDRPGAGCEHRPSFIADIPTSEVRASALELFADALARR